MNYIADLHTHSCYSRATSKASNLHGLAAWAKVKGIDVVGSGDFTHPGWLRHLKENVREDGAGFFRLKEPHIPPALPGLDAAYNKATCRFVLTAEISSVFNRHARVRKVHNLLVVPDFASAERLSARLAGSGNIESDGRPVLGLDAHDLLEVFLELAPQGFLVPAHVWTPWFSLFGSKSGFDTIDECFGDLTEHIFALETGLSSDPDMNRLVSSLDRFTLISNSDCHSPSKLGREANLFDCGFDFYAMKNSIKKPATGGFQGTIEFFPEEGKYHLDGHRNCTVCLEPLETRRVEGICPACGKPLTIGVLHRVMELADRSMPHYPEKNPGFHRLLPLTEVMGEIMGVGPTSKRVMRQYQRLISLFNSELNLFLHTPLEEIGERYSPILSEAINRIRAGKVIRTSGYDGQFGVIRVFEAGELGAMTDHIPLCNGDHPHRKK